MDSSIRKERLTRFVSRDYEGPTPKNSYKFGTTATSQIHEVVVAWISTCEVGFRFDFRRACSLVRRTMEANGITPRDLNLQDWKSVDSAVSTGLQKLRDNGYLGHSAPWERGTWWIREVPVYWTKD